ncbi:hypothetical protein ABVF61_15385 [Roseibium sp. HPY-6]|uniref:hypothetical protein n=1 Tax=Roseibium sp. HPY-6 TaxID=3229852 RepID=UPI00339077DE
MHSAAAFWQGSRRKWHWPHRGDGGKDFHLKKEGSLPGPYKNLWETRFADQYSDGDEVDHIFEVLIDLVALDTDFRHDNCLAAASVGKSLSLATREKQCLLASLFARR